MGRVIRFFRALERKTLSYRAIRYSYTVLGVAGVLGGSWFISLIFFMIIPPGPGGADVLFYMMMFLLWSSIILFLCIPVIIVVGLVLDIKMKKPLEDVEKPWFKRWKWLPWMIVLFILMIMNTVVFISGEPVVREESVIVVQERINENDTSYYWISVTNQDPREPMSESFEVSREVYESLSADSIVFVVEHRRFLRWERYLALDEE